MEGAPTGCVGLESLAFYGALHHFGATAPVEWAAAAAALAAAAGSAAAAAGSAAFSAGVALASAAIALVLGILANNAVQIVLALALFVGWQVFYPSALLLRLVARLPVARGVAFDFRPDASKRGKKYVALTLDDGPCPQNTELALNMLKLYKARATFFIIGSHVEQCDVRGVGDGHVDQGRAMLARMVREGHELGNHTWHDRPSHRLSAKQLVKELADTNRLLSGARAAAAAGSGGAIDEGDSDAGDDAPLLGGGSSDGSVRRRKWFRPGHGWWTREMVEAAQTLGYQTVLGSVWPWDTHSKVPLLNALYVVSKVYSGAVIVLHDRRRHLLPTLRYVLPWLRWWGYEFVTLSEAAARAAGGAELTDASLEAHDALLGGSGSLPDSGLAINPDKLKMSASYVAQMAKERERAAIIAAAEEEERARIKAAKRAEADRRAGIDRRLVEMSAADKRKIERREREKKEAERRKARRKAEEIKAKERYEAYVRQKAQEEIERQEAEAKAKAKEEAQRVAAEEYKKRQEAERAYAKEMVARLRAEQEAAAAAEATAAAGPVAVSTTGSAAGSVVDEGDKKKKGKFGIFKKLSSKLGVSSSKKGSKDDTAAAAAVAAGVGGAAALGGVMAVGASGNSFGGGSFRNGALSAAQLHGSTYAWYGAIPSADKAAALAAIDAALAAQAAAIADVVQATLAAAPAGEDGFGSSMSPATATAAAIAAVEAALPPPVVGRYARGPSGRVLLGFDARPLLLSEAEDGQVVVLDSAGAALTGPGGEQMVLLLGAQGTPLVDPHGRPVFMALRPGSAAPLGVHPDGSIITVPQRTGRHGAPALSTTAEGSEEAALASMRGTATAEGSAAGGSSGGDGAATSSVREANSYAPSLARSSVRSIMSGAHPAAQQPGAAAAAAADAPDADGAGLFQPAPAVAGDQLPSAALQPIGGDGSDAAAAPVLPDAAVVPAQLLLGPHGKPLLGVDNRPLIVAVDEDGVPLVQGPDGSVLLGLDEAPLQLAYASDGSLVALDSQCKPLTGPDGKPRVVALDRDGRPMRDETGRPVVLALGPNGLPLPDDSSYTRSARHSWAGSASGAHLSHSGTQSNLVAAGAGTGAGLEVMVGPVGGDAVGVVDAADYGQYSAAAVGAAAVAGVGGGLALGGFGHDSMAGSGYDSAAAAGYDAAAASGGFGHESGFDAAADVAEGRQLSFSHQQWVEERLAGSAEQQQQQQQQQQEPEPEYLQQWQPQQPQHEEPVATGRSSHADAAMSITSDDAAVREVAHAAAPEPLPLAPEPVGELAPDQQQFFIVEKAESVLRGSHGKELEQQQAVELLATAARHEV